MNLFQAVKTTILIVLSMLIFAIQHNVAQTDRILPPIISGAACVPDTVPADGMTTFLIRALVTDPDSHANLAGVYADLSQIGGGSRLAMYDDGTNGDVTAGDSVFTLGNSTVPSGWIASDYPLTITAIDQQSDSTQVTAWIHVLEPNSAPVLGIITITPSIVQANGIMEFSVSAEVIDENISTVTVNLNPIGGDSLSVMTDNGYGLYVVNDLTVPVGINAGSYS